MQSIQMMFPGGKKKAFTASYDDGVKQDGKLLARMNRHGIKGTFNLNYGTLGRIETAVIEDFLTVTDTFTAEEAAQVYAGHEIACHAYSHMRLKGISTCVAAYQVMMDRKGFEELLGRRVTGFAYPYGAYDEAVMDTLKNCGIHYARTVKSTGNFRLPENFLAWHPTCHHNDKKLMQLLEEFCGEIRYYEPRLFYLWGHSYEFDQRNNWEVADQAFSYLENYKEDIWMATNGEIYDYVKAFEMLEYSADGSMVENPTATDIWLKADDKIFCAEKGKCKRI